ncbi:TorF family putative porin [Colwellia echini]|uniref:Histidine kinase n=1 Tax=Colwellia echini TaxID=1982103 RepID=A0ABY3MVL1_9GAMM|nr:TorF family putative porin [Colwellia echini]TYK65241.1 hypothetical protein CWS31_011310 [Colwellia echini]
MKKLSFTLAALSLATSAAFVSTTASAEVSANVAATSNYLWRGLEQTGGAPAISGGIDYSADSGFYAGTWVSNASWGDMETELDLYLGFSGNFTEELSYDVGYIYYAYPDSLANENDFSEIYGSLSYSGLSFGLAVLATTEAGGEGGEFGDSIYANLDYGFDLGNDTELTLHVGNYSGDFSTESTDVSAAISKSNFTFGVSKTSFKETVNDDSEDLKFYVSYSVDISL